MPELRDDEKDVMGRLFSIINRLLLAVTLLVIVLVAIPFVYYYNASPPVSTPKSAATKVTDYWVPADINSLAGKQKEQVLYGRELIAHTSKYLGPNGSVMQVTNGLNCQNCHLAAGTAVYANNFGSTASLYPKYRARSNAIESVYRRINDCMERSMNGKTIDSASTEMQAIHAYLLFIGSNVEKGKRAVGSESKPLAYLDRAASPEMGKAVFTAKCQSCHMANGEGKLNEEKNEYIYPPLWGAQSFNDGAGLYRLISFANYIKWNMPQGTTFLSPQLTDEEAWDVAAFVLTQSRPHLDISKDWPDKSKKPIDHPFGPYVDGFSELQHKFGPFKPILGKGK